MSVKAVLFDLHGSLAHVENDVSHEEISDFLFRRDYEVSPQRLEAAWIFVAFIDYPKYGYRSWRSYFSRIFWRLKVKVDNETLNELIELLEGRPYQLYPDAAEAVIKAKKNGLRTAIVTTIAYFQFKKAVEPIKKYFDFIMTGFEAGCDKSDPKMYKKTLGILKVAPHEAVMIGDHLEIDVLLPKKLGIHAILLDREGKVQSDVSADAVAKDLSEAVETIIERF